MSEIISVIGNDLEEPYINGTVSRDGNLHEIIVPGSSVFSEDARGYTPFSTIAEFLTYSQMFAVADPRFNISKIRDQDHELFFVKKELEVSLKFYKQIKSDPIYYPMKFSTFVHSVGRSTINLVTIIKNPINHKPVAYSFATMVRTNFRKRRSASIPDEIKEKMKLSDKNRIRGADELANSTQPDGVFSHSVLIQVSDMDYNQHTNYASYYTFCIDGLVAASSQGKLRSFNYEQAPWLVKKWKCNFLKESEAGEMLNVYLWQDDHQDERIYFRIYREDGKPVFSCCAEFYLNDTETAETDLMITSDHAEFLDPINSHASNSFLERDLLKWKQVKASKDRDEVLFMLPGPLRHLLNPKGVLNVVTLAGEAVVGPRMLYDYSGLDYSLPVGTGRIVVRIDYVIAREAYVKSQRRQINVFTPITARSRIHSITRSSLCFETSLSDRLDGTCFFRAYPKLLTFNRETGKAVKNSDEIMKRFRKYYQESSPDDRVKDLPPPDDCFLYSTTVRYSQLDSIRHLSHFEYIRMILDATVGASEEGKFKHFIGDGYSRNMKKLTVTHENEIRYGEDVFIRVWDEIDDVNKLNARVTREDGKLAMICIMEFYDYEESWPDSRL